MSGQLTNRGDISLPGQLPIQQQMNGNYQMSGQMQNSSGSNRGMDAELVQARRFMSERIYEFLMRRQQHAHEIPQRKMLEIIKKLEEGLFKAATTKDEYVNLATLESRLLTLIRRPNLGNHNQQYSNVNSSVGTMIPTPGIPQGGNSSLMGSSSLDNTMVMSNNNNTGALNMVSSGNFLPTSNGLTAGVVGGSLPGYDGSFNDGRQNLPSSFSNSSIGNNMVMGAERMSSQMMPTPGFSNANNNNISNTSTNNQSYTSNNVSAFPSVESTMVSLPLKQESLASTHNGRILHNLGTHMGGQVRAQTSYGMSTGNFNGGVGMLGNNFQPINGPGSSEGYVKSTMYGSSHKQLDQHQQPLLLDDGYGMSAGNASGSENLFVPVTSVGSLESRQNLNSMNMQSIPKTNPPLTGNQSNRHTSQPVKRLKQESVDQAEKLGYPSQSSLAENLRQSNHQFQQHPHQFSQQHLQTQNQQNQYNQILMKNNDFAQSQPLSNQGTQIKSEPELERHHEVLKSQSSQQFQISDIPNRFSQNSFESPSRSIQYPESPSALLGSSSQNPTSQQMFHQNQFFPDTLSDFGSPSGGVQSGSMLQSRWYSKSPDESSIPVNCQTEHAVQHEFHQRITGLDEAQNNNLSSNASINGQSVINQSQEPSNVNGSASNHLNHERQYKNQQKWLLFMKHARRCPAPEGKCAEPHCIIVQRLLRHIDKCNVFECSYPRCRASKILINHHRQCRCTSCPVCLPVKSFVASQLQVSRTNIRSSLKNSVSGSSIPYAAGEVSSRSTQKDKPGFDENSVKLEPSLKSLNIGQSSQPIVTESGTNREPVPLEPDRKPKVQQETLPTVQHYNTGLPLKSEAAELKIVFPGSGERSPESNEILMDNMDSPYPQRHDTDATLLNNPASFFQQESIDVDKEVDQVKQENSLVPPESASGSKSGKPTIKGVSLIELFTPEQVREHIRGLRRWIGQSKAKAEKNQAMEHSMSENSCQLCAVEKLTFEPPPIYCSPCGARIKRNAMYYTIGVGETRHYFCIHCHNESRGDTILADGTPIPKARLEKKKNDEETEEWWVQCDKCEAWQHQICALFNGRRNDGGQAEYTCPNCYVAEVERGERSPLPQSAVLGAKDLPKTILSDHIEKRLASKLKQERQERARFHGKSFDEVPGADSLVVRVVSSVDKKLEVKSRFLEIFKDENYPPEFQYKSKVLLLFQKIEGVEVCLFGMYLQEFGSECLEPNQRRVYLSYLDSVKYFRPDVRTVSGEALRTYVYHEILIAYLEYCKMRGFNSCYIWACPPLKGEDYILYCHPEIQKTPKSDKLREWYLQMLRKAARENIVVELTNLYDHFFVTTGECRAKVTATRLPYFDGDYWPGAAEDMIYQLQQEEEGKKQQKKSMFKKNITKRALKASGQMDLSGNASKDVLLMYKLGETICAMKEDFIMVHLQHVCSHCGYIMVTGNRWVCNICRNFQLCDRCYDAEQKRDDRERHPTNQKDKHSFYRIEINDVPEDTKDQDEILESEFFDTRQAFLSLCQGNHYQYDTLRRAKHSSMMVLYHLHNPTAPAFVTTCNVCHLDIEAGQGWRCETCPEYDVCNSCYQKDGCIDHPHKLTNHPSMADRDDQNKEARQLRVTQLKKMLELLVHASKCRSSLCQYPNCRKVKGLFRHGMQCKVRASGGCVLCKKMWYLLQLHARACKESECSVPRCRDLKDHLKRLQQQSDSRRRAAVMEMMRQRAAEVAGSSG